MMVINFQPDRGIKLACYPDTRKKQKMMTHNAWARVLVVEPRTFIRTILAAFIQERPEFELIGEATCGKEALGLCDQLKPDIVLMGLELSDINAARATRFVRKYSPSSQVIVMGDWRDLDQLQAALAAGAITYFFDDASDQESISN